MNKKIERSRVRSAVEPLLPVTLARGGIRYAPGVKAGPWIFATGHKGVAEFAGPMSPAVLSTGLPSWDAPKHRREADQIFVNLGRVLKAAGSDFRNIVRVDQYYSAHRAVEYYHDARRAVLRDHIPPSTSILQRGFLLAGQEIEVQMIALAAKTGLKLQHIRPKGHEIHPSSGYSLALAAGDLVFVAGRLADSLVFGEGLAAEARAPTHHLWKGMPIRLETEFVIRKKILPALEAAGSTLADVVKCQVYLRDPEDFAAFNEVWLEHFEQCPPATTVIPMPTPGLVIDHARIEVNTIAVKTAARKRKDTIDAGVMPAFKGYPQAVRAGDLLFISGLLAIDAGGLVAPARPDPAQPYFGSSIAAQMEALLANAQRICAAAGTSLANVVRVQQFHTDLAEFYPAYQVWQRHLPGQHLPFSAVQVPFLPVPGCTVLLDLWVYAG
jgi:enamine deaminase RidA (YjgF/YER057c/UK114 family)